MSGVVEKWIAFAKRKGGGRGIRKDLFGFIDIIAVNPRSGVIGVQSTGMDFSGHYQKITTEKHTEAVTWVCTPGAYLWLIGWRKVKKVRGGNQLIWKPRIYEFTVDDFIGLRNPSNAENNGCPKLR